MPKKFILLIEHEADLRNILGDCLSEIGDWQVAVASSIEQGIYLCEESQPDIILVDASTPKDDALLLV